MLYRYRAPFLVMPIAVTLWYMSMDLAMLWLPADVTPWSAGAWQFRKWFSIAFGLLVLAIALGVDIRSRFGKGMARRSTSNATSGPLTSIAASTRG